MIVPIFKVGNIDNARNYKGITLINIIEKVYSQILLNILTKWADNQNSISAIQSVSKKVNLPFTVFLY